MQRQRRICKFSNSPYFFFATMQWFSFLLQIEVSQFNAEEALSHAEAVQNREK